MRMQYTTTGTALNVYLVTMEQLSTAVLQDLNELANVDGCKAPGIVD